MIPNSRKCRIASLSTVLGLAFLLSLPAETAAASSDSVSNITARADYLYNMAWTSRMDLNGWRNQYVFAEGTTHHVPYAQPNSKGGYLYYKVTFEDFLAAAADTESLFYTQQSYSNSNSGSYSTFYGMDCSAMVSYCWELPVCSKTYTFPNLDVTSCGACIDANIGKIEIGDALNKSGSHIVLVTDIFRNADDSVSSYEITEQTTYEMNRSVYTPEELVSKYNSYTILRYNQRDAVTPPPDTPGSTVLTVTGGTDDTETLFAWQTIIENAARYDVSIWSDTYSGAAPLYAVTGLTDTFCNVLLPAGCYEARVDVTTTEEIPFESNTVLFTVSGAAIPEAPGDPGDVDRNGTIDAADAALILVECSLYGTGSSSFTETQLLAADMNGDGEMNAADASAILVFATENGTDSANIPENQ